MELTILDKQEQRSLQRTAINARIFFTQQTPSRQEVLEALAKELSADKELLVVATIHTSFGDSSAHVHARLYKDKAIMQRLERANLLEKHAAPKQEAEAAE